MTGSIGLFDVAGLMVGFAVLVAFGYFHGYKSGYSTGYKDSQDVDEGTREIVSDAVKRAAGRN